MTENKTPTGDFIKLSRRDYQIILEWAKDIEQDSGSMPFTEEEKLVLKKITQILVNIQKFNANKYRPYKDRQFPGQI